MMDSVLKMMNFVFKNDGFCMNNDEFDAKIQAKQKRAAQIRFDFALQNDGFRAEKRWILS